MAAHGDAERIRIRNLQLRTGKSHLAMFTLGGLTRFGYWPALRHAGHAKEDEQRRAASQWIRRVEPAWTAWRRRYTGGSD